MTYKTIDVLPLAGALGAEIFGVDLARPLGNETFSDIHRAFLDHLVIFFRDQTLTPTQLIEFARRFGTLDPHHVLKGMDGHPEILEIIREPTDTKIFAPGWHADVTWQERPVLGAALYGLDVPDIGGDTLFANQYLAYDTLSPGLKAMLEGLRAVHGTAKVYGDKAEDYTYVNNLVTDRAKAATYETVHPVVRTHPETGRKALFLNDHYVLRFEDMTAEESMPLLNVLWQHAVRPEFTCRFRWRAGSIALWDNRCLLHTPIDDYFGKRRHMWRITIGGDRPV
ncbi:MAG: TauD/TfdA family dioxygenase [Alphaproteobacteria bacterium]